MQPTKCENCSAWSQLMAEANGETGLRALCLNPKSERHGKWTRPRERCAEWSDNPELSDLR